jgi:hypothetical protein
MSYTMTGVVTQVIKVCHFLVLILGLTVFVDVSRPTAS